VTGGHPSNGQANDRTIAEQLGIITVTADSCNKFHGNTTKHTGNMSKSLASAAPGNLGVHRPTRRLTRHIPDRLEYLTSIPWRKRRQGHTRKSASFPQPDAPACRPGVPQSYLQAGGQGSTGRL